MRSRLIRTSGAAGSAADELLRAPPGMRTSSSRRSRARSRASMPVALFSSSGFSPVPVRLKSGCEIEGEGGPTGTLIPRAVGKGRVLAAEVLVVTPAIRALIRDDKVHQIYSLMQGGKKFGMQTLNDALNQLYLGRQITVEEALRVSGDPNEFLRMTGQTPTTER